MRKTILNYAIITTLGAVLAVFVGLFVSWLMGFLSFEIAKYTAMVLGIGWLLLLMVGVIENGYAMRVAFWEEYAKQKGWKFQRKADPLEKDALLFNTGFQRHALLQIHGVVNELPVRIFQYVYRRDDEKFPHFGIVLEYTFTGSFPHIYLNTKGYGDNFSLRQKPLSMPIEFADRFTLYGPNQYEIEALNIFTPDILAMLLDSKWKYDIELIHSKLIIFVYGYPEKISELDDVINQTAMLVERLTPQLNRLTLTPIGDLSFVLR